MNVITRRDLLKATGIGSAALIFPGLARLAGAAEAQEKRQVVTVTLFNTGDLHEHSGNLARIAGFIKQRKKEDPNVLFVDAGDFLDDGTTGEAQLKATRGDGTVALMAAAGYDACILGNHDYKFGKDRILELCHNHPKFPLVVCNMRWSKQDQQKATIPRYKIFQLKGVKVAVVGSGSRYMNHAHGPRFPFFHEREGYREVLPEVRKKADIIIFISHRWEGSDKNLLNAWRGDSPDVLVGGHSHKRLVWRIGKTLLIKAGCFGRWVGATTIKWDGEKIISCTGRILPVSKQWPEDPDVKALRAKYFAPAQKAPQKAPAASDQNKKAA